MTKEEMKSKARVIAETLSDGSIVFNVMVRDEVIAHPPSQFEAQQLSDDYNERHERADIANVRHEEVMLSCVRREKGTPVQVLAEINGQVLIGGKFYTIKEHCWLDLKPSA